MERQFVGLLVLISSIASGDLIRVNSADGKDSSLCLKEGGGEACETLTFAAMHPRREPNLTILLETDTELNGSILFENLSFLQITGFFTTGGSSCCSKEVRCSNRSKMLFKNVSSINISNVVLTHCGALDDETKYEATLIFKSSSDISLLNVTVAKSQVTGIAFLACSGNIKLKCVKLLDNGYGHRDYSLPAGISIEVTDANVAAHYSLKDCSISNNQAANISHWHVPYNDSGIHWKGRGLGGGIGVYFSNHSSGNSLAIEHSNVSNNMGRWGGGLYLQFQDFTENNNISIKNSSFHHNKALVGGGGVSIVFLNDATLKNRTNCVLLSAVGLVSNWARKYGGGMTIESTYGNQVYVPGMNIKLSNCTLSKNNAPYSPAVDVAPYFYNHSIYRGFLPIPLFANVEIVRNVITNAKKDLKKTSKIIAGVFSITQFTVYFSERVNFTKNRFTALLLSSANVVFDKNSISTFNGNVGSNGAGIALYGSTLILSNGSLIKFTRNIASQYGGGIFYQTTDQHTFITGTSCFIQYDTPNVTAKERNITLVFRGNVAHSGGSSVYADSFYSCLFACAQRKVDKTVMKCIGNVSLDEESEAYSTLQSYSSNFTFGSADEEYAMIPGSTVSIPFSVKDEFNQTVTPLMSVGVSTPSSKTSLRVTPEYTLTNELSVRGLPNDTARLHFITQGTAGIYFLFQVKLRECPPGFYFNNHSYTCQCSTESGHNTSSFAAITYCNFTTYRAHMKRNYWAGYIPTASKSHQHLYFAPCFPPMCRNSTYLPNSPEDLESSVCFQNRKGIMCGRCSDGYSTYFNSISFLCKPNRRCKLGPLLYLASEILPVCLLFAVIVIFDFTFTSGDMVGFIFFSQYLDRLTVHSDSTVITMLRRPYRIYYGIFNFNYFSGDYLSFCLWKNFQILDVIFFKYITIVVSLVLVLSLVAFLKSNHSTWLLEWRTKITMKTSFVQGLSAFFVICYSQCTRTSFLILKSTSPKNVEGAAFQRYSYYGGLPFLKGRHLIYAIPAIFSLIFVTILPPLILLVYPLSLHLLSLCHLSEHWIVNRIMKSATLSKLMPFMDCFQSCYKDKLRFFAGLYFVYRVVILCTYTLFETSYDYRMTSEISLILFLGIHAVVQPYKKRIHNFLDSLIFLNLALINAISIYSNFLLEDQLLAPLMLLTTIQLVLLYLPMAVSLLCAVIKTSIYFKRRARQKNYEIIQELEQN